MLGVLNLCFFLEEGLSNNPNGFASLINIKKIADVIKIIKI